MKNILMLVMLLACVSVCPGRTLKGVSMMGATMEVTVPGDRGCPLSEEDAEKISEAYGKPLVFAVVTVDNQDGSGPYKHYYGECRAMVGDDQGVSPVDVHGSLDVPWAVTRRFFGGTVAKGETKWFARAFPVPEKGGDRLKSVLLRTWISDEWVSCQ